MGEDYQTVESLRTVDGDVRPVKNKSFGAREIFIELCINLVWLVLTLVDVVLTVLLFVYNLVCAGKGDKPKDVVIIGSGHVRCERNDGCTKQRSTPGVYSK